MRAYTELSEAGQAGLLRHVAAAAAHRDALTVQLWEAVSLALQHTEPAEREFLADELAGALNVHPQTARALVLRVEQVDDNPALIEAARRGELTENHVLAALSVLTPDLDPAVRARSLDAVITRYRWRAHHHPELGWPTPGAFKKALRAELLTHDQEAARKREQAATDRRGVWADPLPDGQAQLVLVGPAAMVLSMKDRIDALAQAGVANAGPDDSRNLDNHRFDAGYALLTCDGLAATTSSGPVGDAAAGPFGGLRVRGIEVQLITPFSTAEGGDLELAELAGYGPVLPATARELMAQADHVRRVVVDATTGEVLTVDDATPITGANPRERSAQVAAAVRRARTDPVVLRPLSTEAYRPALRILRHIRLRDRTCVFPGCTRQARWTDADHRDAWPLGKTAAWNLQCVCRHHHRAKQARFEVALRRDGTTVWTSRVTGRPYFRPPPDW